MKIFIIAGEKSGDMIGGLIMQKLNLEISNINYIGIGGDEMIKSGLKTIFPMKDISVMGFLEIVPHIFKILKRINFTAAKILEEQPDLVITIDSPDFCFRVVKKIRRCNIKTIHIIAPTVWAYRENRAKKISKLYDHLLCILPFEPPYFEKYGLKTSFIGHTSKEILENLPKSHLKISKNSGQKIICITPGSRKSEVKRLLPIFTEAGNLIKNKIDTKILIPTLPHLREYIERYLLRFAKFDFEIYDNSADKIAIFQQSDIGIAKSGTNTIEMSISNLPIIVAYRVNYVTYIIGKILVKIKFANLVNLILNREVIPELIQLKCNSKLIAKFAMELLENEKFRKNQLFETKIALDKMGLNSSQSPSNIAKNVILLLIS